MLLKTQKSIAKYGTRSLLGIARSLCQQWSAARVVVEWQPSAVALAVARSFDPFFI